MESRAVPPFTALRLNRFRVQVRLGWGEEERKVPQSVLFDLAFRFTHPPKACRTDQLEDTICYADICSWVEQLSQRQEYRLIEKLGCDVYGLLKAKLPADVGIWVRVTKEKPPIAGLEQGSSFSGGDWDEA